MTGGHLLLLLTGLAAHPRQVAPSLLSLLQQSADEPTAEVAALLATEDGVLALHIQTEEKSGNTPLHVAATRGWSQVTRLLAEAGADIEHTNAQQATPLVAATQQPPSAGQLGAISTLLEAGADVNAHPSEGHSALHICARDGNDALCATLLSAARVDPNIRTAQGQTPLHLAARNGHTTTCRLLLRSGASPAITNNFGLPAWANAPASVADILRDPVVDEL